MKHIGSEGDRQKQLVKDVRWRRRVGKVGEGCMGSSQEGRGGRKGKQHCEHTLTSRLHTFSVLQNLSENDLQKFPKLQAP